MAHRAVNVQNIASFWWAANAEVWVVYENRMICCETENSVCRARRHVGTGYFLGHESKELHQKCAECRVIHPGRHRVVEERHAFLLQLHQPPWHETESVLYMTHYKYLLIIKRFYTKKLHILNITFLHVSAIVFCHLQGVSVLNNVYSLLIQRCHV